LKKFLHDEYEFVVFNDAPKAPMAQLIDKACTALNIRCIRIPQNIHSQPYLPREPGDGWLGPSIRHANCVQYSLDLIGFDHNGIVMILDSDMFLIRTFSLSQYMENKHISAFIKTTPSEIDCLCPVLTILHMSKLPDKRSLNFNCGYIHGWPVDSGGWTHYYLIKHPELIVKPIYALYSHQLFLADKGVNHLANIMVPLEIKKAFYRANCEFNRKEIAFLLKMPDSFEFYLDNHFLHYRGGSTTDTLNNSHKFRIFNEFLEDILS